MKAEGLFLAVHCRAARVEGNLDDQRRRYLSVDAHHVLGGARAVGIGAAALSSRECFAARACAVLLWRVLRSLQVPGAWLGAALWALHPVQVESVAWITEMKNTQSGLFFLLSILFFVKWLRARDLDDANRRWLELCVDLAFRRSGDGQQVVHGDSAGGPLLVRLVGGGPVALAQPGESGPDLSDVRRASAVSMWTQGLQLATPPIPNGRGAGRSAGDGGRRGLVLSGQAALAASVDHDLSALADRCRAVVSYLPLLAVIIVLFILWLKRESWSRPWFFASPIFWSALLPVLGLVDMIFFAIPWSSIISSIWPAWGRWRWRERGWSGWRISSFRESRGCNRAFAPDCC
jgi:hypothetical protein